jgi:nucleoside-diphosphate-sugar epimerase
MANTRVMVTGVTGYIAGHCVRELLAHGYDVRGTVRDLAADVGHLRPFTQSGTGGSFEVTQARLESDDGWAQAVEGCDYLWLVNSLAGPKLVSSEKARKELGWTPRPVRESIVDNAEDLVARGVVRPKRG